MHRLAGMLATGSIAPLQTLTYGLANLATALRTLAHARNSGKVVMEVAAPEPSPNPGTNAPAGAWAVAGGLGALGGLAGGWLCGLGARHVALLGRSGRHAGVQEGTRPVAVCDRPRSAPAHAPCSLMGSTLTNQPHCALLHDLPSMEKATPCMHPQSLFWSQI